MDSASAQDARRIGALERLRIIDTPPERAFDDLVELAASICEAPIALVSLVETKRQWFKARVGLDACETSREVSFCSRAIEQPDLDKVFLIPDATKDPRFKDNPLVTRPPNIRLYAGAPLVTIDGTPIGSLCVIDNKPRHLTPEQINTLQVLARSAVSLMELNIARLEAETANASKDRFLSAMSHEIRTPLNGIIGFADLLRTADDSIDPAQRTEWIDVIHSSGRHLLTLLNDVLDLSKITAGEINILPAPIDPAETIRSAASIMRSRAEEKNIDLTIDIDPSVPRAIRTDPTRLRQIVMNLTSNAVKFTKTGSVHISATMHDKGDQPTLRVTVKDTGIGMTQKQCRAIFKPFKQATPSTASQYGGTGLGLTISLEIARRLGGDITVTSTPGAGSTFTLELPAPPPTPWELGNNVHDPQKSDDSESSERSALKGIRTLIVDDYEANRVLAKMRLESEGASVKTAASGEEAIKLAKQHAFDVILMDLQMPGLTGAETAIRLQNAGVRTPVVALTAQNDTVVRPQCDQAGIQHIVLKPFDPEMLISTIQIATTQPTNPNTNKAA